MRTLLLATCSLALLATACTSMPADQRGSEAAAERIAALRPDNCIRETGTRVMLEKDKCSSLPGHSFSGEEIRYTGDLNTADALRRLDPTLR